MDRLKDRVRLINQDIENLKNKKKPIKMDREKFI